MGNKTCISSNMEKEFSELPIPSAEGANRAKDNADTPQEESKGSKSESSSVVLVEVNEPQEDKKDESVTIIDQYRIVKQLGSGISGDVLIVEDIVDSKKYALKRLDRRDKWSSLLFSSEVRFLESLADQEYVIKLIKSLADAKYFYVLTELGSCDLFSLIRNGRRLDEKSAKKIVSQLLNQLVVLHERNIAHRDIKAENVILADEERSSAKLIDFANATNVEDEREYNELVGTTCYLSPERWNFHQGWELKASDVWAVGVLTFELVTGKRCFVGDSFEEIHEHVKNGEWRIPSDRRVSNLCEHFIECLLTMESNRRPSAKLALLHPWLHEATNDYTSVENELFVERLVREWNFITTDAIPIWACYRPVSVSFTTD